MYVRTKGMTNERRPAEDLIFENISEIFIGPFFLTPLESLERIARIEEERNGKVDQP